MGKKIEISAGCVLKVFNHVGVYSASTKFSIHVVVSATDEEVNLFPVKFISPTSMEPQIAMLSPSGSMMISPTYLGTEMKLCPSKMNHNLAETLIENWLNSRHSYAVLVGGLFQEVVKDMKGEFVYRVPGGREVARFRENLVRSLI
jgi:hypothetical protein